MFNLDLKSSGWYLFPIPVITETSSANWQPLMMNVLGEWWDSVIPTTGRLH